jgi:hypothetical protein
MEGVCAAVKGLSENSVVRGAAIRCNCSSIDRKQSNGLHVNRILSLSANITEIPVRIWAQNLLSFAQAEALQAGSRHLLGVAYGMFEKAEVSALKSERTDSQVSPPLRSRLQTSTPPSVNPNHFRFEVLYDVH